MGTTDPSLGQARGRGSVGYSAAAIEGG
jgi:hypothetical protein